MSLTPLSPEDSLYPFSTQEGLAIPLEIIRASGLQRVAFGASSQSIFTSAPNESTCFLLSDQLCVIQEVIANRVPVAATLVSGQVYDGAVLIPAWTPMTHAMSASANYRVSNMTAVAGSLFINYFDKWQALANRVPNSGRR